MCFSSFFKLKFWWYQVNLKQLRQCIFFSNVDKILKYICCQYKDRQVYKWVQNFNVLVTEFSDSSIAQKKSLLKSFRLLSNLRWRWNSYQQQFEIEILNMHPHFKGKKANLQQANKVIFIKERGGGKLFVLSC